MLSAVFYSVFNILSVVCIVVVNKMVFQTAGFHFPTLLVCIHCAVTHIGLRIASSFGAFERKIFPQCALVVLAVSFIGYNVASLANLSLNTVGFYQISKIMSTPATMLLESLWLRKKFPREMLYAVGLMCIGVGLATVTDLQLTFAGGLVATVAAFGAAQSYIFIGKTQRDLKASSNQLLVAYTPYCAAFLLLLSPVDTFLPSKEGEAPNAVAWAQTELETWKVMLILFSGCIGLLVSLSTFLLIKATSALTYNIVGHAKTICILLSGVLMFGDEVSSKKLLGIMIALGGMVWYGQIKLKLRKEADSSKPKKSSSLKKIEPPSPTDDPELAGGSLKSR